MRIALKIDVDTLRGTRVGVPELLRMLQRHGAGATFYFSMGPDNTGRALRRVFRPGFLRKVQRTSVVKHYGLRTLTYGVLWPGPHIGRRAGAIMRQVRDAGFEVGIHTFDHVRWQDNVVNRDAAWTAREFARADEVFHAVFGAPSRSFAAAGWQINAAALRIEGERGFDYCSDTRGQQPFMPIWGEVVGRCPQLPTTLPTFDELIGRDGMTEQSAAAELLRLSRMPLPHGHVFTLHAELEGMRLAPVFDNLLRQWRAAGHELVAMENLYRSLDLAALPRNAIEMRSIEGRSGTLAMQVAA